jgi:hypothetical protein
MIWRPVVLVSPLVHADCFPVVLEVQEWRGLLAVNPILAVSVQLARLASDARVEICCGCRTLAVLL